MYQDIQDVLDTSKEETQNATEFPAKVEAKNW